MVDRLSTVVSRVIDELFQRCKDRLLGPKYGHGPKRVEIAWRPDLSLPWLFSEASREEGGPPSEKTFAALARQASAFLDAQKASAKARALAAVRAWMQDAAVRGSDVDPVVVLGGELGPIWKQAVVGVEKIFDAEGTVARNTAVQGSVARAAALSGEVDPTVCFMAPKDEFTCKECLRLHFVRQGDAWCPRTWKMSELKAGYAKKGDESPSLAGQHPHCRGTLTTILPGYGFVGGSLEYVGREHDELKRQRSL